MTDQLPCIYRGEVTGELQECGQAQPQPVRRCYCEFQLDACLLRLGTAKHLSSRIADCSACDWRNPGEAASGQSPETHERPRVAIAPRPGDHYRRVQMEENLKRREQPIEDVEYVAPDHSGEQLVVNQSAGGLGDAMLGLLAVTSLSQMHPSKRIVYKAGGLTLPFLSLFSGPHRILLHDNYRRLRTVGKSTGDMQLNSGYAREISGFAEITRVERYCRNIGVAAPTMPVLREPDKLLERGKPYAGAVLISPYCANAEREYPLNAWLALERSLSQRGLRVIIVDRHAGRCNVFASEKLTADNTDHATIVGAVLNSRCVIGSDSGIPHLAGALGRRVVVLCGQTRGEHIFNAYPRASWLYGTWGCEGCYWSGAWNQGCRPRCPALASIQPDRIVEEVLRGD